MVVGTRQSFQFFKQKIGFLEIKNRCFNLGIRFCKTLLVLPNCKEVSL